MSTSHSLAHALIWGPLKVGVGRTLLSIITIALGVALGFSIDTMNRAATTEMTQAARGLFGQADLIIQGTAQGFDETLYPTIAHIKGVSIASPIVQVEARLPNSRESITLLGMDLLRAAQLQPGVTKGPSVESAAGESETAHGKDRLTIFDVHSLLLSASAARSLHANSGDAVRLQAGTQLLEFKVIGVLPAAIYAQNVGVLDIAAAQWRLQKLGVLTRIDVRLDAGANLAATMNAIAQVLPPNVTVTTPTDESLRVAQLSRSFTVNLTALALVALFTGAFLVYATQSLAVTRRRKEFALLCALGVTRREQICAVIFTGALLGIVGATFGLVLGALLAKYGIAVFLGNLNIGLLPRLYFPIWNVAGFLLLGVAVSIAGSVAPAIAAANIPTAQALKAGDIDGSDVRSTRGNVVVIGFIFWTIAPLLLLMPAIHELPLAAYASIALILLGAVLLIPTFTRRAIQWLPKTGSVVYQTAISQLRGTSIRATVSVATILVSVSLMVAMGIMVTSLRGSFADSLDRMLAANIYVSAGNVGNHLDAATVQLIAHAKGVQRIEPSRTIEIMLSKQRSPVLLIARPLNDEQARSMLFLETEAKQPAPSDAVEVWISVALADRYHLRAGDELQIPLVDRSIRASVRGTWRNNGSANDAMMMDLDRYRKLSGDTRVSSLAIWLQRDASLENTMQAIRSTLPNNIAIDMGIPAEQRAARLAGFDRVFAITYLLEAVAVLIGLFGISVSASAQALARRTEFGVLRHLGFTRKQIGRLLAFEGFGLGLLGALAGLCIGAVISLILIYVVGRQSFHWVMDIHVPVLPLIALIAAIPIAAAVTSLWSGRAAMSDNVVSAVKEDW